MPTASVYAASKAAVTTLTECLASQLESRRAPNLRASIFYPSGGLLRTGLWTADRNRPAELARERPRTHRADDDREARGHGRAGRLRAAVPGPRRARPGRRRRHPRRALHHHDRRRVDRRHAARASRDDVRRRASSPEQPRRGTAVELDWTATSLISADGHAGPPAERYRDYLDPAFRDRFDEHQAELAELRAAMVQQRRAASARSGRRRPATAASRPRYDSDARNAVLDRRASPPRCCSPTPTCSAPAGSRRRRSAPASAGAADTTPTRSIAGARAHNRWLADFCAEEPAPPHRRRRRPRSSADIDDAVRRDPRGGRRSGLRGHADPDPLVRPARVPRPVVRAGVGGCAEELGLVLHTHSGAGPADYRPRPGHARRSTPPRRAGGRPARSGCCSGRGVFERHPDLKYSIAENGAWWVPDLIRKMDEKWVGGHNTRKFGDAFRARLSMKPSDYLDRNCFFAASTPGRRRHRPPPR